MTSSSDQNMGGTDRGAVWEPKVTMADRKVRRVNKVSPKPNDANKRSW